MRDPTEHEAPDVVQMQLEGARAGLQPTGVERCRERPTTLWARMPPNGTRACPPMRGSAMQGCIPVWTCYYGNQRQLEYDFVVAAGADPKPIRLRFDGAKSVKLDGAGNLVIAAGNGDVAFQKPVVYQMEGGRRRPVKGAFGCWGTTAPALRWAPMTAASRW